MFAGVWLYCCSDDVVFYSVTEFVCEKKNSETVQFTTRSPAKQTLFSRVFQASEGKRARSRLLGELGAPYTLDGGRRVSGAPR